MTRGRSVLMRIFRNILRVSILGLLGYFVVRYVTRPYYVDEFVYSDKLQINGKIVARSYFTELRARECNLKTPLFFPAEDIKGLGLYVHAFDGTDGRTLVVFRDIGKVETGHLVTLSVIKQPDPVLNIFVKDVAIRQAMIQKSAPFSRISFGTVDCGMEPEVWAERIRRHKYGEFLTQNGKSVEDFRRILNVGSFDDPLHMPEIKPLKIGRFRKVVKGDSITFYSKKHDVFLYFGDKESLEYISKPVMLPKDWMLKTYSKQDIHFYFPAHAKRYVIGLSVQPENLQLGVALVSHARKYIQNIIPLWEKKNG